MYFQQNQTWIWYVLFVFSSLPLCYLQVFLLNLTLLLIVFHVWLEFIRKIWLCILQINFPQGAYYFSVWPLPFIVCSLNFVFGTYKNFHLMGGWHLPIYNFFMLIIFHAWFLVRFKYFWSINPNDIRSRNARWLVI